MNRPRIIFFNSYKGGVGRTFVLVNLSLMLTKYLRKKVLIVDMDVKAPGVASFFKSKSPIRRGKTLLDAMNGTITLDSCVVDAFTGDPYAEARLKKLFILPAADVTSTEYFETILGRDDVSRREQIQEQLNTIRDIADEFAGSNGFDIVIFDFPAGYTSENIVKDILGDPHLICFVSNLNKQGKEGLQGYLDTLNRKAVKFDRRPTILPILNKVYFQHPSHQILHDEFHKLVAEHREDYPALKLLDIFDINFFHHALVGEFNLASAGKEGIENLLEYPLDSPIRFERTRIQERSVTLDELFGFYENMHRLNELIREILYPSRVDPWQELEKVRLQAKLRVLIEKTNYSDGLSLEIKKAAADSDLIEVDSLGSNTILEALFSKVESLSQYDLISLPFFALQDARSKNLICSLESIVKSLPPNELREIGRIRTRFGQSIMNVDSEGETFGIPLTNISAVIVFDANKVGTGNLSYDDILSTDTLKWGMVDSVPAYSHYYEFANVLGSYNLSFFDQSHPSIHGRFNINQPMFREALSTYYRLLVKSTLYESWNKIFDGLTVHREIDACFLWTEQLVNLGTDFGYCEIPMIEGTSYNQAEGWFLVPVKNDDARANGNCLALLKKLSGEQFQGSLFNNLGSSSSREFDEQYIERKYARFRYPLKEGSEDMNKLRRVLFIQRVLENVRPKANFKEVDEIMKSFCKIVSEAKQNHGPYVDRALHQIIESLKTTVAGHLKKNYLE